MSNLLSSVDASDRKSTDFSLRQDDTFYIELGRLEYVSLLIPIVKKQVFHPHVACFAIFRWRTEKYICNIQDTLVSDRIRTGYCTLGCTDDPLLQSIKGA